MTARIAGVLVVFLFLAGLCSAKPSEAKGKVKPASGKELCSALAPADFTKAGVSVSSLSHANLNPNDNTGAYCLYDSKAGQVEFDIFYPAGNTPEEAKAVEKTVLAEAGGPWQPVQLAGADSAQINLGVPGKEPDASITVRKKNAVFNIAIPTHANARQQLLTLAQRVLSRL